MSFLCSSMRLLILPLSILIALPFPSGGESPAEDPITLLFFGDSLTFGYGLDNPGEQAYPARVRDKLDAAGIPAVVIPSGLSGETTAGGARRISWVLRPPRDWPGHRPFELDVFVLALGGNDGLRGIDLSNTKANLLSIIETVREKYPGVRVVLAGVEMPVNWGETYREGFARVFREVAEEAEVAAFLPSLLQGVGANPELMQNDRIHPNADGHRIMAELVWETLAPILKPDA